METLLHFFKFFLISLSILLLTSTPLFPQNKNIKSWTVKPFERKAFIENKGQFENYLPPDKKTFKYSIDKGYQVFFYTNEICYRFTKPVKAKETVFDKFKSEEKQEAKDHELTTETQLVTVKWLNANPNATIEVEDKRSTYYSYVINNKNEKPVTVMCDGYSKLIYKNLYNGIDVEYIFHPDNGIEYNLLVHPGADVSQVKMQYSGANKNVEKDENINISTFIGDIIDHAPATFYADTKEKIRSSFNLTNNIVSFNLSTYSKDREVIIDPWTVIPGFTPSKAFDNGVDNSGNILIYGGSASNFTVEKYASTGGAPIWSMANTGIDEMYYGDMLVEGNGNFYLCEGYVGAGAHTYKYSPTSSLLWQSTSNANYREHWRLALNCITNKVIVAGGGTTSPTLNIAEIDVTTGTLLNAKSVYSGSQSDVAGLCVDELGKSYLKHSNPNIITFTDNANNFVANINDGYSLYEVGNTMMGANGFNFMALGGTTFLFTSDGATIKKWDRNTYALLASATIPGGVAKQGSGILADKCNNLFVGASNGVYRYDFDLVQKEFHSTSAAVYDIAYAINSDIVASGLGFLTPLAFGRQSCISDTLLINSTNPCNSSINTVTVRPNQGTPPFTFLWDDGNTDSTRTNLPVGVHIVTVRDGSCVPSFHTDSVIVNNSSIRTLKINPLCNTSADGQLIITLLKNQTITSAIWTPVVTNSQPNDSTIKASGLLSGTYHCHLTSSSGCTFDTSLTLTSPPQLLDSIKGRPTKCPGDLNGSAIAFGYGGTGSSTYSWNTIPIQTTQTATGLSAGKHIVTVADSNSCIKIDSILIGSNPSPTAAFTSQPVCFGDTSHITNTSTITSGGFTSFWLLGCNGLSATTTNIKYLYPICNKYLPTLIVTSDSGCVATRTDTVFVNCLPTAAFTVNNVCTYKVAAFNNASLGASSYSWDFDYNTGIDNTTQSPTHLYAPGNYNIELIAASISGCLDTVIHGVTIYPKPIADFTGNNVCLGDSTIFGGSSTIISDTISNWVWNYGDNSPLGFTQNPVHLFASAGSQNVSLVITTNNGCKDTSSQSVVVHPLPTAQFSAENVCDGSSVSFIDHSFIPATDSLYSWSWNFGDGSPVDANQNTSHLYAAAGSDVIKLLVKSNFGCLDSISKTIIINPNPIVNLSANDTAGCQPLCVIFQNSSTILTGSNIKLVWNVGEGSLVTNSQNFNHCYTNNSIYSPDFFNVTLTVTSDSGCVSTKTKNNYITAFPSPVADFSVQPQTTTFTDPVVTCKDLSQGPSLWNWNFGDFQTDSILNPSPHTYADTGNYVITLLVTNQYGCVDSTFKNVTIEPDFHFYIPNAFSPNGDGINDSFSGKGVFIKKYEMMIFDRWGDMIFFTDDIDKPWDGKANQGSGVAQQDVYIYSIKVTDNKRKEHNYKGIVTLVR